MLDHLGAQFEMYRNLGFLTGIFGLLICVTGFRLWYVRVQQPLDMANRGRATSISESSNTEGDE
jgi:hypothetical protein